MKLLVCLLLLISMLQVNAALTPTSYGGTQNNTTQTTLAAVPSGTMTAGCLGVALFAFANSGTSGSTKIFTQSTFNDSVTPANTWTLQFDALYNPSGVASGVEIAVYTAPLVTQITVSDNVTVTVSTATTGKTCILWAVCGNNGYPTVVTSAAVSDGLTTGQTTTTPSVTTSSITTGDWITGFTGYKLSGAPSALDTDTLNGSWVGSPGTGAAAPMRITAQGKTVTGTGTQTYNITIGSSAAWENGWIQIREAVAAGNATNGFF